MSGSAGRRRRAAGPERPRYLAPEDIDKVMAIVLALMAEVAALRERVDVHERLGDAGALPGREAVEGYAPTPAVEAEQQRWHDAYLRRLLRVMTEEIEPDQEGRRADA